MRCGVAGKNHAVLLQCYDVCDRNCISLGPRQALTHFEFKAARVDPNNDDHHKIWLEWCAPAIVWHRYAVFNVPYCVRHRKNPAKCHLYYSIRSLEQDTHQTCAKAITTPQLFIT